MLFVLAMAVSRKSVEAFEALIIWDPDSLEWRPQQCANRRWNVLPVCACWQAMASSVLALHPDQRFPAWVVEARPSLEDHCMHWRVPPAKLAQQIG